MRLHLLGLPHTVTTDEFSHCAFTGKVKRFSPMMRPLGYELVHYGVAGAESGANEQVDVMTAARQHELLGHAFEDKSRLYETNVQVESPLFREFNAALKAELERRVEPVDIVLNTYGYGHYEAVHTHRGINIESGIGYPDCYLPFRVYDSYAWQAFQQGKHGWGGNVYEWVVPNYFAVDDWPITLQPEGYVLYFGRLGTHKGCHIVAEIARHMPDIRFVLCGQGDPSPFLTSPNIEYRQPVHGSDRAFLLGGARAVLMPTQYIEPFGKVAVEAMLTGTPVIASPYGAFPEILESGKTGFMPRVLQEWIRAIELAPGLDRRYIANSARERYSLDAVGPMYDAVFRQLHGLYRGHDWYSYPGRW